MAPLELAVTVDGSKRIACSSC